VVPVCDNGCLGVGVCTCAFVCVHVCVCVCLCVHACMVCHVQTATTIKAPLYLEICRSTYIITHRIHVYQSVYGNNTDSATHVYTALPALSLTTSHPGGSGQHSLYSATAYMCERYVTR